MLVLSLFDSFGGLLVSGLLDDFCLVFLLFKLLVGFLNVLVS